MELAKIRRFKLLQKDCLSMRETMMTAAIKATDQLFPRSAAGEFLNCYMSSATNNRECQQLNCYDGFGDALERPNAGAREVLRWSGESFAWCPRAGATIAG